ncbi:negative elongation factor E-like [Ruditapes philippinarum]|uniref:negative elongation factor E-like n=1 Tax=Ruditapes philippinarum TaxID=129788 RepID=UPI00295C0E33|nr:negative elongation factor E-like [Ruditapes philippinarum]
MKITEKKGARIKENSARLKAYWDLKKKQLQALKTVKPEREPVKEKPVKRPHESAEDAKEQAKKLVMSGAIKLSDKKEKQGFKRSRNLEKKLQDPEKLPATPATVGFQPFAASHPDDEERVEREDRRPRHQRVRGLYDNFVRSERPPERPDRISERPDRGIEREDRRDDRDRRERPDRPDREPLPKKGNTVYVHGHGVNEELLRKAFHNFGNIVNISMEKERNCGFVTFDKMDCADMAIQEVDGAMIDSVQLRVSMARRQPSFDSTSQDPSSTSWASLASNNSQKGSHKDKRDVVAYEEDMF